MGYEAPRRPSLEMERYSQPGVRRSRETRRCLDISGALDVEQSLPPVAGSVVVEEEIDAKDDQEVFDVTVA